MPVADRGRPSGAREKPFRDELRRLLYVDDREELRKVAKALIGRAKEGDPTAIRELADRLEGKVPQAVVGDNESDPIRHIVTWEKDAD